MIFICIVYFVLLGLETYGVFYCKQGGKLSVIHGRRHAGIILKEGTPRMIIEKGLRFQSVGQRSELGTMPRHAVITNNVGGIAHIYNKCVTQ